MPRPWRNSLFGRKLAPEQIASAEELKAAFLVNVNHQIRNPLNIIAGHAELLSDRVSAGDHESAKSLTAIVGATRQLERNLRAIIDLSRLESGMFRIAPVSLEILSRIRWELLEVQPEAENKGLRINLHAPDSELIISIDEYCFTHALANVLDNAMNYTEHGAITVRVGRGQEDVLVEVEDTGVGIDPADLPKLFRPFSRGRHSAANPYGMGLGLALAKRYLALNGADLLTRS
jgi:signal transduction histidine kinase